MSEEEADKKENSTEQEKGETEEKKEEEVKEPWADLNTEENRTTITDRIAELFKNNANLQNFDDRKTEIDNSVSEVKLELSAIYDLIDSVKLLYEEKFPPKKPFNKATNIKNGHGTAVKGKVPGTPQAKTTTMFSDKKVNVKKIDTKLGGSMRSASADKKLDSKNNKVGGKLESFVNKKTINLDKDSKDPKSATTSSRSQSKSTVIKKINFDSHKDEKKRAESPKPNMKKSPPIKPAPLKIATSPKRGAAPIKGAKVTKPVGKAGVKNNMAQPSKSQKSVKKEDAEKKEEGEEGEKKEEVVEDGEKKDEDGDKKEEAEGAEKKNEDGDKKDEEA